MKTNISIYCILCIFILHTTNATGQIPYANDKIIENITFNNQYAYFSSTTNIISPSTPTKPVLITGTSEVTYRAGSKIFLKPGFKVSALQGDGKFRGYIKPTIQLALMCPDNFEVGKYEKLELGIIMPDEITNLVDNYLNNNSGINPYNPNDIDVYAIFTSPSGITHRINGFYYKRWGTDDNSEFEEKPTDYNWRIRFAPDELYNWTFSIHVQTNVTAIPVIAEFGFKFNCIQSDNPGYLEVGQHYKQLRFSGTQGSFFAIGQNIAWPKKNNIEPNHFVSYSDFIDYFYHIYSFGQNYGNFVRVVATPWGFLFENETLGNYDSRQHAAKIMDGLLEYYATEDIYMMYSMQWQGSFINEDATTTTDDLVNWDYNPYNSIPGIVTPKDFFANTAAKEQYKKYLRYFIARWGYSTHLGALQLFSEVDGVSGYEENAPNVRDAVFHWHEEMSAYVKSLDNRHLVSTSFAGGPGTDYDGRIFNISDIDFTCNHRYQHARDLGEGDDSRNCNVLTRFDIANKFRVGNVEDPNINAAYLSYLYKPFIFDEMGIHPQKSDQITYVSPTPITDFTNCTDINFHNDMWATAMMCSFGTGFNWWTWDNDSYRSNFRGISNFMYDVDFETVKYAYQRRWNDTDDFFESSYTEDYKEEDRVEFLFMLADNKEQAFGWVHNRSYYWYNLKSTIPCISTLFNQGDITEPDDDDKSDTLDNIANEDAYFEVKNLKASTSYTAYFFDTNTGNVILSKKKIDVTNLWGKLKIKTPAFTGTNFDYGVKIMETNGSGWKTAKPDSNNTAYAYDTTILSNLNKMHLIRNNKENDKNKPIDKPENIDIDLYPNPTSGIINIDINGNITEKMLTLQVFDIFGRKIKEKNINSAFSKIDISGHAKGIYLFVIKQNNKTYINERIIFN